MKKFPSVLSQLVDAGDSVLATERNLAVIKTEDWIVDLKPDGGPSGSNILACSPPEKLRV